MARQLYTEAGDKKVDAKLLKKLTPAQKAAFEKLDKKHKKVKYQDQDTKIDRKLIAKVKAKSAKVKAKKK
jgi:hypothetical protein